MMKYTRYTAILATMVFAFSFAAFAKDNNSGRFTLDDSVQVGSTQLAPGNYKVEWSGPATSLKVEILKNGKTVATTEGKLKDLQHPAPYDSVMIKPTAANQKTLDEIDFDHRSEALVLGGE
jgi:hypothetical protein